MIREEPVTLDLDKAVAELIHQARREARLTQEDLARIVGLHKTAISEIETRRRRVSMGELKRIADAVSKPMTYFLYDVVRVQESVGANAGERGQGQELPSQALDELMEFIVELKRRYRRK